LLLFVWFIGAFLWDGNSYKDLRNTYDPHHLEQGEKKVTTPKPEEKEHGEGVKSGEIH
jgi:hypothetical protein